MIRVLNLGAGTQSSVLLLMSETGEIPPVDVAVFANTGWEPAEVMEHFEWLRKQVKKTRIEVVTNGNIYDDMVASLKTDKERVLIPLYTLSKDGNEGITRRQCTKEYKIDPITKFIKSELLGLKKGARWPKTAVVEQVFGISYDEMQRMRVSQESWCVYQYPLIDMRMRRQQVIDWAKARYPEKVFPRSACVGCPYHDNHEWSKVASGDKQEWQKVVELDALIRNQRLMNSECFLHPKRQPIDEIDFRSRDEKNGQMSLWQNECEGMCGV